MAARTINQLAMYMDSPPEMEALCAEQSDGNRIRCGRTFIESADQVYGLLHIHSCVRSPVDWARAMAIDQRINSRAPGRRASDGIRAAKQKFATNGEVAPRLHGKRRRQATRYVSPI